MKVSFKSSALACALALVCGAASFSANTLAQDRSKLAVVVEATTVEDKQAQFEAWQAAAAPKIAARTEIIGRILSSVSADAVRLNPNSPSETLRGIGQMLHLADMETLQQAAALTGLQDVEKFLVLAARQDAALPASNERRKAALGDGINLVFTPITPCRIADSRGSSGGILVSGIVRNYLNFSATGQGGTAGCNQGSPGIANQTTGALALTFTVTQPTGGGFLQVAPLSGSFTTSVANWDVANQTVANSSVLAVTGGGADFKVQVAGGGNAHVIIDLLGFYLPSEPAALTCVTQPGPSTNVAANARDTFLSGGTCASGTTAVSVAFSTGSSDLVLADSPVPSCRVSNLGATATTAVCQTRCCSIPGSTTGRF